MRKRNFILQYAKVFILTPIFLTSCIKDPDPPSLDAMPDVYAQKIVEEGEEKYALAFWVLGNKELESVIVESPDEETWSLEATDDDNTIYSLFPDIYDYTPSVPEAGLYTFTVTSTQEDEESLVLTDELEDKELSAVVIDNTEFVDGELTITWDDVESNDIYYLRLIDESEQIIFGRELSKDASEFSFGLNDQGWANQNNKAEDGKTYRIELLAILYESGVTFDKAYHIQFISIGSTQIVWGE